MERAELDLLANSAGAISSSGSVAMRLLQHGLDPNALRTNDVLRREDWLLYDRTVIDVTRARLVGVADLLSAGLRFDLTNPLGTTMIQYEKMSDMTPARTDMSGLTEGERDRLDFSLVGLPVPITHKEFQINIRALAASRNGGQPLDTTQAQVASRRVNDALEDMLFNGVNITAGGGTIYGYTTAPGRNTGSLTANWATATGDQVIADILTMIGALQADNMFGPYMIYTDVASYVHLLADFKTNSDKSILSRLLEIPLIGGIKSTTRLSNEVLMIQMTSDVVDLVVGFQPTPVMWESHGGMMINCKVMAIMVPRVKSDYEGRSGIVHFAG